MENFADGGCVCAHLLDVDAPLDAHHYFTGAGVAYHLICRACAKSENPAQFLIPTPFEVFDAWDSDYIDGIVGTPEIKTRRSNLTFSSETIALDSPLNGEVLAVQPAANAHTWFALLSSGDLVILDLEQRQIRKIISLEALESVRRGTELLRISPLEDFAVVANATGQTGVVVSLAESRVTMSLDRSGSRFKYNFFPAAFFTYEGKTLLIHATLWDRLDISDPKTGELLTPRDFEERGSNSRYRRRQWSYGRLWVSPDHQWIAEEGWAAGSAGISCAWNLGTWYSDNQWESDDGASFYRIGQCWSWCDRPMCWLGDSTLVMWGFGNDSDWHLPAVRFYDLANKRLIRWFAGVQLGDLYIDRFLFSASVNGTEIWDVETGEKLHADPTLAPLAYHPVSHEFLSVLPDGAFRISRLSGEE